MFLSACSSGGKSIIATFEGNATENKWAIQELNPELPSNWSEFEYLTFDYKASSTQRFFINVYDAGGRRRLRILPFQGAWVRASVPLLNFQSRNTVGIGMAAIGQTGS